ncbi:deoxycytidyl transferase [Rhinocladiella similis]
MGSRLEKNSTLVRKRIESHTFSDEQGEEYEGSKFGGFADYMRRKKIKLQNLDAEIRSRSSDKPPIFRGVVVHVNGYTQPSLSDLHNMVVSYGGGFLQYLDGKTAVTHVVASNLTPKKAVEFARYRIVKPGWVVDSVKAGRLLPWDAYRLVDEGVTQKVLGFENGQITSQTNSQKHTYRDQSETSWYTSQLHQGGDVVAGTGHLSNAQSLLKESDSSPTNQTDAGLHRSSSMTIPPVPEVQQEAVATSKEDNSASNARDHVPSPLRSPPMSPSQPPAVSDRNAAQKPEKRQLTAEEHNALLLQNPHVAKSSTANPDFINQYYRESRLHHLSTWKAELKAQMQARAQEKSLSQKSKQNRKQGARRYVMHIDFDSFFAAVSLRKHPHLSDKPVVIAHGSGPGSEIASCNYPARKFGIKNGMWMKTALEMCSDLKILPYDYKAYEEASRHFYDSILTIDGIVQSISIDEALIDVSEQCIKVGGSDGRSISEGSLYREQEVAQRLGNELRALVKEKTGCDVSVGIGGNILLAKVALRKAKPAGQHLIKPEDVLDFIGELTVTELPGVAWSIGNKLEDIGIKFVKDIRSCTKERLINTLGPKTGEKLWDYSRGIDKQEVGEQVVRKSVSAEINWGIRFINQQQAEDFVQSLSDELSRRLLEQLVKGKQLTMKIMRKAADAGLDPPKNLGHGRCDTFNKSVILGVATNDGTVLGREAISILRSYNFPPGELRGLGVQMQKLEPLKPPVMGSDGFFDGSQRRLQFKKPPTPSRPAEQPGVHAISPSVVRSPKFKHDEDPIEEIPTPEKGKLHDSVYSALDNQANDATDQKPLNVSGTQFIMPSQIDPTVLAELPSEIRNKLAPKQKSIMDSITRSTRSQTTPIDSNSRSTSPYPSDNEAKLPRSSQIDPETLAALPQDLRDEILAQYKAQEAGESISRAIAYSPRKPKALSTSKKTSVTPTKRQKTSNLFGKAKPKRVGDASSSTLTQSNFVSSGPKAIESHQTPDQDAEEISESFLNELPEDIRLEVLEEQKRSRMKAKSGLNFESVRKKTKVTVIVESGVGGQQRLQLAKQPDKPTFTSQRLSSLPELRDAISAWVREFSSAGDGPDQEDVNALADYLVKVVTLERDMAKAVAVVNWLGLIIEYENFTSEDIRGAWEGALTILKQQIQIAVKDRGLPAVAFEC